MSQTFFADVLVQADGILKAILCLSVVEPKQKIYPFRRSVKSLDV